MIPACELRHTPTVKVILSSASLLKLLSSLTLGAGDYYDVIINKPTIWIKNKRLDAESSGNGEFKVSSRSLNNLRILLTKIEDQPIVLKFGSHPTIMVSDIIV